MIPCPPELLAETAPQSDAAKRELFREKYGAADWYDWCVLSWGTKWDVGGPNEPVERVDPNTVNFSFSSAWSPPTDAYVRLMDMGFSVEAYYNEFGMGFCGSWIGDDDGFDDNYIEYSGESADTVVEKVGPTLDEMFGISESLREWEEEYPEEQPEE